MTRITIAAAAAALLAGAAAATAQPAQMTFFVTSAGSGDGAKLGGLAGADALCAQLATAAGAAAGLTWKAYLSTAAENARDRIGAGPWHNAKGEQIAASVADLHSDANNITKQTALTEKGTVVPGRGDKPNQHDILTGSKADGTVDGANTCGDWTLNGEGSAMLGHVDRMGPDTLATAKSWNAAHPSRGCSQEALIGTGGNGYFYCFAAN